MITVANAELDSRILRTLDAGGSGFATAWFLAKTLGVERQKISDRMKSLKKRQIVECTAGGAWSRVRRAA